MATGATAKTPTRMKMTTNIPAEITTPDSVEMSLGTLNFLPVCLTKAYCRKARRRPGLYARRGGVPEHHGCSVHLGQHRRLEERGMQQSDGCDPRESRGR